jgi:hypothetical protein
MLRSCAIAFTLLTAASRAAAQVPPPTWRAEAARADVDPPRSPTASVLMGKSLRILGGAGMFDDPVQGTGGLTGSVTALVRIAVFEVGIVGQGGSAVFGYNFGSGAVLTGLAVQTASGFRADLLGEIGFDSYSGVGASDLFGGAPPGASGTLPVLGARLGLGYRFLRDAAVHPELAGWFVYDNDVGRTSVEYSTPGTCTSPGQWFCTPAGPVKQVIGTQRIGGQITLGVDFDLH